MNLLRAGGLTVQLAVDPKRLKGCDCGRQDVIPADNRVANAITMVEPATGYIKGMAATGHLVRGKVSHRNSTLAMAKEVLARLDVLLFTLVAALEDGAFLLTPRCRAEANTASDKFDNPNGGYHNAEGLSASDISISRDKRCRSIPPTSSSKSGVGILAVADTAKRLGITSTARPERVKLPRQERGPSRSAFVTFRSRT